MNPNATLVERIIHYVQNDAPEQASALATLGEYLEECYLWDISFEPDDAEEAP